MSNNKPFKFPDFEKLGKKEYYKEVRKYWNNVATHQLVGRTIYAVNYMKPEETKENYWYKSPIKIWLTAKHDFNTSNRICLIPSKDDEGNDGGALHFEGYENDEYLLDTCLPTL